MQRRNDAAGVSPMSLRMYQHVVRAFASTLLLFFLVSCVYYVKTRPDVDFTALQKLDLGSSTRNDIEIALGTPQGRGLHRVGSEDSEMAYYSGLSGKISTFPTLTLQSNSGVVYVSYGPGGRLLDIVYAVSTYDDGEHRIGGKLALENIPERIVLGKSTREDLIEVLGAPDFRGRRYNASHGFEHEVLLFDASGEQRSGLFKEQW